MTGGEGYAFPSTDAEAQRLEFQGSRICGGVGLLEPFMARKRIQVLDVGCGNGFFTRHVARALPSADVAGLDIDEPRITYARSRSGEKNTRFEPGDMASMPFASDSFGLVFCRFALVHSQDPSGAFREGKTMQMPLSMLHVSPFRDFRIPGLILSLVPGLAAFLVAAGLFFLPALPWAERLNPAKGKHWSWAAAIIFGLALMTWITVQVAMIGGGSWLQPLYFGVGLAVVAVSLAPSVREYLAAEPRSRSLSPDDRSMR